MNAGLTVVCMNANHALCATPEWADHIHREVLGSLLTELDLGDEMLEIGPGPGAATEWLRTRVRRLVAIEVDPEAAQRLADRYNGSNVEVATGDASHLDFADESFDSVGTFTMLHHLPTLATQNQVLKEAWRVLRPAGILVGSDSLASTHLHDFHNGDTYNPIEASSLIPRLQTIGFDHVMVSVGHDVRFVARKPSGEHSHCAGDADSTPAP
ncbi:MAG: class I SAM-dependent methyltransferase [Candidatus Dormiibacterota bacterium]